MREEGKAKERKRNRDRENKKEKQTTVVSRSWTANSKGPSFLRHTKQMR